MSESAGRKDGKRATIITISDEEQLKEAVVEQTATVEGEKPADTEDMGEQPRRKSVQSRPK